MSMWNRTAETLSRDEYAKIQLEGLKKSLNRVWGNEFYRTRLQKGGLSSPADVKSLDDLSRLPLFTKDDFRDAYPLKMNCVSRRDLLEFHMSSGSTGTPVVMAYTKNDLLQWAECMARCYAMAGLEKGDALKESELVELEQQIKPLYPDFANRLYKLYNMSRHEYHVCLLLKVNIPPVLIASALCREVSSISSTRSRLYGKVFGKKGSSKEWDAFISTL